MCVRACVCACGYVCVCVCLCVCVYVDIYPMHSLMVFSDFLTHGLTCLRLAWPCPWPKMVSKWVTMKFPDLVTNRKVVGNVENYLHIRFQPNILTRSREYPEKLIFYKIAYKKKLGIFSEKPPRTFLALIVVNICVQKLRNP